MNIILLPVRFDHRAAKQDTASITVHPHVTGNIFQLRRSENMVENTGMLNIFYTEGSAIRKADKQRVQAFKRDSNPHA